MELHLIENKLSSTVTRFSMCISNQINNKQLYIKEDNISLHVLHLTHECVGHVARFLKFQADCSRFMRRMIIIAILLFVS